MSDKNQKAPVDRLVERLGFNPAKQGGSQGTALAKALEKLRKEHEEESTAKAYDLLKEGAKICCEKEKCKTAFEQADKKFDKTLGKLMNKVDGFDVKPVPEEEETAQEEATTVE